MATKTEIISLAFNALGKAPVNDPSQDPISQAASKIYDVLLPDMLTWHPWRFAMEIRQLDQLTAEPPIERWQYAFQLPSDMLLAYRTDPVFNYEIYGKKLFTNISNIKLEYVRQVQEIDFPVYFTQMMVDVLAAKIAMTVTQNIQIKQALDSVAATSIAKAKNKDSQQMPNPVTVRDPILQARGLGTFINSFGAY